MHGTSNLPLVGPTKLQKRQSSQSWKCRMTNNQKKNCADTGVDMVFAYKNKKKFNNQRNHNTWKIFVTALSSRLKQVDQPLLFLWNMPVARNPNMDKTWTNIWMVQDLFLVWISPESQVSHSILQKQKSYLFSKYLFPHMRNMC